MRQAGLGLLGLSCALVVVQRPAEALEISGGVSLGAMKAGARPRLAVSPHAGISWQTPSGFLFAVHDFFSLLPETNRGGVGVYNQTSIAVGYAWEKGNFSLGPSLSIYFMPACYLAWCGRVAGLAPGVHGQANVYLTGPLGVSVSANVDWLGGSNAALPESAAAMVVAGPVLQWGGK